MNRIEFEGYRAWGEGGFSAKCPYREGSREWLMWQNGYIAAEAQEARRDNEYEYECDNEQ